MGHCSMGIIPIILGAVLILGLAKRAFFRRRFGYGGGVGTVGTTTDTEAMAPSAGTAQVAAGG